MIQLAARPRRNGFLDSLTELGGRKYMIIDKISK